MATSLHEIWCGNWMAWQLKVYGAGTTPGSAILMKTFSCPSVNLYLKTFLQQLLLPIYPLYFLNLVPTAVLEDKMQMIPTIQKYTSPSYKLTDILRLLHPPPAPSSSQTKLLLMHQALNNSFNCLFNVNLLLAFSGENSPISMAERHRKQFQWVALFTWNLKEIKAFRYRK